MPRPRRNELTYGIAPVEFFCSCGHVTASKTGHRLHRKVSHGLDMYGVGVGDCGKVWRICSACSAKFHSKEVFEEHCRSSGHMR